MTINFYNQSSPTNKINKVLGNSIGTCVIDNIHDINVIDPVFIIKSDALGGSLSNLAKANYVVAGAPFNRSYFITGVDFSTAKTAIVYCHCDVLSTYAGSLGTLNFTRGENDLTEVEDTYYPISDYIMEQHYYFNGWADNLRNSDNLVQYILRTVATEPEGFIAVSLNDGDAFRYQKWVYNIHKGAIAGSGYITFYAEDPQSQAPGVQNNGYINLEGQLYKFVASNYMNTDPELSTIVYLGTA